MTVIKKAQKFQRFEVVMSSVAPMPALPALEETRARRHDVAFRAWLMSDRRTERGYVMDMSMSGARVTGAYGTFPVGSILLLKFQIDPREPTLTIRSQVTRFQFPKRKGMPEIALQFVDIKAQDRKRLLAYLEPN